MTAVVRMPPPEKRGEGPQALSSENQAATKLPDKASLSNPGLEQAMENAASDWWHSGAMLAIKQLALSGCGFTVDHIRDMAGEPEDPHYWGALFAAAQKLKIIEAVGARVGRDGRLVRVWWGLP